MKVNESTMRAADFVLEKAKEEDKYAMPDEEVNLEPTVLKYE